MLALGEIVGRLGSCTGKLQIAVLHIFIGQNRPRDVARNLGVVLHEAQQLIADLPSLVSLATLNEALPVFHGELLQPNLCLLFCDFILEVEGALHQPVDHVVEPALRVTNPYDAILLVDHKRRRDASLAKGAHVGLRHGVALLDGDGVFHLFFLPPDEALDGGLGFVGDADHGHALALVFFLQLGQVRDAVAARPAPRRPKLNNVNFLIIRLGQVDRLALDPVLNLQLGRLGADVGGLRGRNDAGQCRAEED